MQKINLKKYFFLGFTILMSAMFFLSIEPGRSIKTWSSSLWIAAFFFQFVVWGYFFFKNSNVLLSLLFLNLYIILIINLISTPFTSSIKSYYSLPKNINIKRILNDDTMYGFKKNKEITTKTDIKGFRVSDEIDYSANSIQKKIILFGASQVEEIYLNFAETWGYQLSKSLIENFNERIEVVNTGVSGLRVDQIKKNLLYFIKNNINGEYYFFLFGQNDWNQHIVESNLSWNNKIFAKFSLRKSFLMQMYTLIKFEISPRSNFNLTEIARYGKSQSNSLESRKIFFNKLKKIPNDYIKITKEIVELCKNNSLNCVFLESPNAYSLRVSERLKKNFWQTPPNTNYSLKLQDLVMISELYNNWLKEFVENNGFLFCELNKFIEPTEKFFYDDSHLNSVGAKKISQALYKCIK